MYSDADCHRLADLVVQHRNIIECKRTDAVTWKEKVIIMQLYVLFIIVKELHFVEERCLGKNNTGL